MLETLSTPAPAESPSREIHLTPNARLVLSKRYLRRGEDGKPIETVEQMFERISRAVAAPDAEYGTEDAAEARFFDLLTSLRFFPNSPTFTGAGTPLGQLAACFTPDMRVTTDRGVKRIADLQVGDRVLTHQGRYRPVTELFQRAYNGELLHIKIKLIGTTLEVTPEHPILTPGGWVKAGELKAGDRVAIGLPEGTRPAPHFDLAESVYADELELQAVEDAVRVRRPSAYQNSGRQAVWVKRHIDVTPELARLCGYYVSEGTIGPDERYVRFTFNQDEVEYQQDVTRLIEGVFGASVNRSDSNYGHWTNINVYSRPVVAWFREQFGQGAAGKYLPVWLQYAPADIQEEFLVGLMRGDGMYFEKMYSISGRKSPKVFRSVRVTLSNPGLIQQIWQMCLRLGYDAAVRPVDTKYVTENAGDTAQVSMPPLQSRSLVRKAFGVDLPEPDARYLRPTILREDDRVFFEIEAITSEVYSGTVYNCEVDEDHSYVTEGVTVHNCFVLPIDDDMGKDANGIFQTLRNAALIQQTGGGNGFSFSRLRPKGDFVATSAGTATGPVGFLRVYDKAFGEIAQGGSRRGANMGVLRVDHPDVMEFIRSKADEGTITNFNISVALTDSFMQAVKDDTDFALVNPRDGKVWQTMRARDIFDEIVKYAHRNGEPGCLFIDAANRTNPVPHLYALESTNPCVTGDTLVATPDGWRRADAIREGDEICTVLGTGRVASIEVHTDTPVYNVYLSDGSVVCVTAAHQFHVRDSRTKFFEPRRLDQLQAGDWVRVARGSLPNNPVPQGNVVLDDQAYGFLVGVLVGDGCYTPHTLSKNVVRLSSHADDEEWNTLLQSAFAQLGVEKVYTYVNEGSRSLMMDPKPGRVIAEWVRSLPLAPARGPEKTLPDCYINSNREFLTGLLDGLFSTDGSVDLSTNHPLLRFHTSSETLAQQLRRILLMFGVHGRIAKSIRQRHAIDGREVRYDRPKYDVLISGSSLGRFVEQIRLSHPEKQRRLEEATLRCNHTGGNWAAKVVRVELAGKATVYDLYEPRTDTWITEGYVSRGCGEQWLGPYENCCLGSINLAQHFLDRDGRRVVDWAKLQRSVEEATHFLDNVVSANKYVPAVPELREAALRARRIGLGIMGLGDLMYALGVRYGSRAGEDFAGQIMEFVRYHCMRTSVELARQRGPFTAIQGSIYDPQNLRWQPPTPLQPYTHDWGRPAVDWDAIVQGIRAYGIRNAAQTTIAPTGTIATVAGCEGYGCEPVFALAYVRHVKDPNGGPDIDLTYASPLFEQALIEAGVGEAARQKVYDKALNTGTCQDIPEVPASVRDTFVVASDITPEEHVRMQAAMQAFVDNSLSKCVTDDTLVMTAEGLVPIASLSDMRLNDQFEAISLDVLAPKGVKTATSFYYGGMRETRRVRLSYGYEIEGTPNHRIHVLRPDGTVDFARLDELKIGDTAILYSGQRVFGRPSKPLPAYDQPHARQAHRVTFPAHMSDDLAYLLGVLSSEGHLTDNTVGVPHGDRRLLEQVSDVFERVFGLGGVISTDSRKDTVHYLSVHSRHLVRWLETLGMRRGAANKTIPPCVLAGSESEVRAFLRGLFLDAYLTLDGRMFGIGLASLAMIRQLQTVFLNFGIVSNIHQAAANAWALAVSGEALDRLAEIVEFDEVHKRERLLTRNEGRQHHLGNYASLLPPLVTEGLREAYVGSGKSLRALYGGQTPDYQRVRVNMLQGHRLAREEAQQVRDYVGPGRNAVIDRFFGVDQPGMVYVQVEGLEAGFKEVFDISVPEGQAFIANGLCNHNTCNFPEGATVDDVAKVYMLAWELGCKGLTVYVTGSREEVVLETKQTLEAKKSQNSPTLPVVVPQPRERQSVLSGRTYRMETPIGTAYVTVNDLDGEPYEVFINVGKGGSDIAAVSEALGRLCSLELQTPSPLGARERAKAIVHKLRGIAGSNSVGFGPNRVASLPDAIAVALNRHIGAEPEQAQQLSLTAEAPVEPVEAALNGNGKSVHRDICPECGQATLVFEEGCRHCSSCGYSKC